MREGGNKLGEVVPILGLLSLKFCSLSLFSTRYIKLNTRKWGILNPIFLLLYLSPILYERLAIWQGGSPIKIWEKKGVLT